MKKLFVLLLAVTVVFCGAFFMKAELSINASAKDSPIATTAPDVPVVTSPTTPGGSPAPSGTTVPGMTSPTWPGITAPSAGPDSDVLPTSPDGSTVTGTVSDTSPQSPETGDGASGIFAFAGVVVLCATAAVLSGKKKGIRRGIILPFLFAYGFLFCKRSLLWHFRMLKQAFLCYLKGLYIYEIR